MHAHTASVPYGLATASCVSLSRLRLERVGRTSAGRACSFEEVSREVAAMRAKAQSASSHEEKMFWQRRAIVSRTVAQTLSGGGVWQVRGCD
jgi:hypothetical protein